MAIRKNKLEELGGFDEGLAYGEDEDLARRMSESEAKESILESHYVYTRMVSSLAEVFRQGRWYGKSMPQYFSKHPEAFPSLLSIVFFFLLPFTTLGSLASTNIAYAALVQYLIVFVYVLIGFRRTRNPYIVFVPLIKIVRSYAEIVGMFEGLFTEDLGRE